MNYMIINGHHASMWRSRKRRTIQEIAVCISKFMNMGFKVGQYMSDHYIPQPPKAKAEIIILIIRELYGFTGKSCQIVVNVSNAEGVQVQDELIRLGWKNFWKWMRYDDMKPRKTGKIGWFNNAWSKSLGNK